MSISAREADDVAKVVEDLSQRVLNVYRADPGHVLEHANNERRITQGGYGERQIYELVQNGADENTEHAPGVEGTIHVLLTDTHLYCANTGTPMTAAGADTILRMAVSRKRTGKIGRFGGRRQIRAERVGHSLLLQHDRLVRLQQGVVGPRHPGNGPGSFGPGPHPGAADGAAARPGLGSSA